MSSIDFSLNFTPGLIITSFSSGNGGKPKIFNIVSDICFQPKKNARFMNDYFLNVASALVSKLPSPLNIFSIDSTLQKKNHMSKFITNWANAIIWELFARKSVQDETERTRG